MFQLLLRVGLAAAGDGLTVTGDGLTVAGATDVESGCCTFNTVPAFSSTLASVVGSGLALGAGSKDPGAAVATVSADRSAGCTQNISLFVSGWCVAIGSDGGVGRVFGRATGRVRNCGLGRGSVRACGSGWNPEMSLASEFLTGSDDESTVGMDRPVTTWTLRARRVDTFQFSC